MKILVLGGTQFIGRHFAQAALAKGHEVTLFHRGSKGVGSVPGAEDILGDRTKDLGLLAGKSWDAVMDSSGYLPGVVRQSAEALRGSCGTYQFISTVSVYDGSKGPVGAEESPLVPIGDPNETEVTGKSYGYLKVLCEQVVEELYGENSFIVRPGIVAGSHDPTNRFTYWVMRYFNGGEVLVPKVADSRMELIDVRDLSEFVVHGLEAGLSGAFNAAGPESTFGHVIATCARLNPYSHTVWVDPEALDALDVKLGKDLPLALLKKDDSLFAVSSDKAVAHGLSRRHLDETAHDVIAWQSSLETEEPPKTGMTRERELEVLAGLNAQSAS